MTKKLSGKALVGFEASRDVWQEVSTAFERLRRVVASGTE